MGGSGLVQLSSRSNVLPGAIERARQDVLLSRMVSIAARAHAELAIVQALTDSAAATPGIEAARAMLRSHSARSSTLR